MEIILLESLNKLGKAGEIVSVKDGFAKNYLIPQKKAIIANKKNKSNLETKIEQINQVNIKKISNAKLLKEKIDGKNITIEMEANDDGGLYGAITQKIIADEITSSQNVDISPDSIIIGPIRELGEHQIQVRIYEDVISKIILTVSKKS
jgi:ribosomal protein L9